jgi:hypothetical protein
MKSLWALYKNRIHSIWAWLTVQENSITSKKLLTGLFRHSLIHPNTAIQLSGQLHTHQAGGWVSHRARLNTWEKGEMCPCIELKGCTGTTLPLHFGFILKREAVCL